jgi:hypothetical protein
MTIHIQRRKFIITLGGVAAHGARAAARLAADHWVPWLDHAKGSPNPDQLMVGHRGHAD